MLYAIKNGGFSGAVMPQNVVVGQQAIAVAEFVATYAGRQAPAIPGITPCERRSGRVGPGGGDLDGESHGDEARPTSRSARPTRRRPPRRSTSRRRARVLDIHLIRRDPDAVRAALARRGDDSVVTVDLVLELDQRWRAIRTELEELQAEQNRASRGRRGPPTPEEREQLAALAARGRELSDEESRVRGELDAAMALLPNLPAEDAPDEDTVLREVGEAGALGRDHLELAGPRIDMEHAAQVSGSRFAYLLGDLVLLEFALVRFVFERLLGEGFEPVVPPVLVRERALYGSGFLPDTEQQIYHLRRRRSVSGRDL